MWRADKNGALASNLYGLKATLPLGIPILLHDLRNLKISLLRLDSLRNIFAARRIILLLYICLQRALLLGKSLKRVIREQSRKNLGLHRVGNRYIEFYIFHIM